jgi:hypothetical protein
VVDDAFCSQDPAAGRHVDAVKPELVAIASQTLLLAVVGKKLLARVGGEPVRGRALWCSRAGMRHALRAPVAWRDRMEAG